ncbi:MAG: cell division protein FtsQ/DivIB [Opitutaceae bacterium]
MKARAEIPREQSWRDIRQSVRTKTMTTQGRRRFGWNLARATFSLLLIGALGAVGIYLYQGFETPAVTLAPVVRNEPLREIVLINDGGVLTRDWVAGRLALPEGVALMAIDLDQAKAALEREGQVKAAVLTRDFPGTLVVTIEERVPVLRVLVPRAAAPPEPMFVSREGVIYRGYNYDAKMVRGLPWMDGVRLTRLGSGFVPVEGVDRVSELLLRSRAESPQLAEAFRVVSLAELPRILVRTEKVKEIVFEGSNYRRQLARLDYILEHFGKLPDPPTTIARIDLSVESQVAVRVADASAAPPPRSEVRFSNPPFISNLPDTQANRGN